MRQENVSARAKQAADHAMRKAKNIDWEDTYEDFKESAVDTYDVSKEWLSAHPFYSILGAAAVGYLFGIVSRRQH